MIARSLTAGALAALRGRQPADRRFADRILPFARSRKGQTWRDDEEVVHGPIFHANTLKPTTSEEQYLLLRRQKVQQYFPAALGVDDYMARLEIELCKYGFSGDNSIAMLNLCRDEICNSLKKKIEVVFGAPFNTHGLGAVLTCGVTGMKAGLSHCPVGVPGGREKYIFFSFPHIAVNAAGELGKISRAARPNSNACGALLKVLQDLQQEKQADSQGKLGEQEVHDVLDPEYSILKHRLEQHVGANSIQHKDLELHSLTLMAEKAITQDLETLIKHSVDSSKADYAVVTGIQIHNWANDFEDPEPNLEFVQPCSLYVVVDGGKIVLDINAVSALTPRMIRLLAGSHHSMDLPRSSEPQVEEWELPRSRHQLKQGQHQEEQFKRHIKSFTSGQAARGT